MRAPIARATPRGTGSPRAGSATSPSRAAASSAARRSIARRASAPRACSRSSSIRRSPTRESRTGAPPANGPRGRFIGAALAYFLARSRFWQRPRLGLPTEALYVVPVYALLIAGCVGRDPAVLHALWLCAIWSLALIAAAGLAARRRLPAGGGRVAHALILVAANGALFYAVLNHAAILDSLFFTVAP